MDLMFKALDEKTKTHQGRLYVVEVHRFFSEEWPAAIAKGEGITLLRLNTDRMFMFLVQQIEDVMKQMGMRK